MMSTLIDVLTSVFWINNDPSTQTHYVRIKTRFHQLTDSKEKTVSFT